MKPLTIIERGLAQELREAAIAHGAKIEDGYYLWEAYDEVPESFVCRVDDGHELDEMGSFCFACAKKVIETAKANGWDGLDEDGDELKPRPDTSFESDPGSLICEACSVRLDIPMTEYAVETEVEHFASHAPTTADDVLCIAECLEHFNGVPHRCDGCSCESPINPQWINVRPEGFETKPWERMAHRTVELPCPVCLKPRKCSARDGNGRINRIELFGDVQALVAQCVEIVDGWKASV